MAIPKKFRHWTQPKEIGNSLFVLIPALIRKHMRLGKGSELLVVYDSEQRKITIRRIKA